MKKSTTIGEAMSAIDSIRAKIEGGSLTANDYLVERSKLNLVLIQTAAGVTIEQKPSKEGKKYPAKMRENRKLPSSSEMVELGEYLNLFISGCEDRYRAANLPAEVTELGEKAVRVIDKVTHKQFLQAAVGSDADSYGVIRITYLDLMRLRSMGEALRKRRNMVIVGTILGLALLAGAGVGTYEILEHRSKNEAKGIEPAWEPDERPVDMDDTDVSTEVEPIDLDDVQPVNLDEVEPVAL